jgi:hypothetical protein
MSDQTLRAIQDELTELAPRLTGLRQRVAFYINGNGGRVRRMRDGKLFKFAFAKTTLNLNLVIEGYPINKKSGKASTMRTHDVGLWSDIEIVKGACK